MEPFTFRGRDTEHWLSARLSGDDETRWEAIDAIRHLCAPDTSVPLLLDTLLNDHYGRARGLAAHALYDLAVDSAEEVNWAEIMPQLQIAANDPDDGVRQQIAELFDALTNPRDAHS